MCLRATVGDVVITMIAFAAVALRSGRGWIRALRPRAIVAFSGVGVAITVVIEILSTKVWDRWQYSDSMPVVPLLDVGLLPIVQWIVLPPLVAWLAHRQIGTGASG